MTLFCVPLCAYVWESVRPGPKSAANWFLDGFCHQLICVNHHTTINFFFQSISIHAIILIFVNRSTRTHTHTLRDTFGQIKWQSNKSSFILLNPTHQKNIIHYKSKNTERKKHNKRKKQALKERKGKENTHFTPFQLRGQNQKFVCKTKSVKWNELTQLCKIRTHTLYEIHSHLPYSNLPKKSTHCLFLLVQFFSWPSEIQVITRTDDIFVSQMQGIPS